MSSCMTKLEILPEPHMLFRLRKLPLICWLFLHWVLSSFVDPYERFVMLLKSRSCTHHIYLLLLHWEYRKTCLPSRCTQKCCTPTLGVNTKTCLLGFLSAKSMLQVLVSYLSKFCCRKETWGYAKIIHKKEEKKELKKMDKCPRYWK